MSISNDQAKAWINNLRKQVTNATESLTTLRHQYFLLNLIVLAIKGDVTFSGAPVIEYDAKQ
jgi:hypothetical protein